MHKLRINTEAGAEAGAGAVPAQPSRDALNLHYNDNLPKGLPKRREQRRLAVSVLGRSCVIMGHPLGAAFRWLLTSSG